MILAEIQCLPTPAGTPDDHHAHVEAAIDEIERAGVHHEVGALGTTLEGEADVVWPLLRRVHDACLAAGADTVISNIKVYASADGVVPAIDDLTAKFRNRAGGASPSHDAGRPR
jgi:uncharacterized protein YqgV (UPF0045/DUF77 family)